MSDPDDEGLIWPPVREDPPAAPPIRRRGKTDQVIEYVLQNPGWHRVGLFRSQQAPTKQWAAKGAEVVHRKLENGMYARFARALPQVDNVRTFPTVVPSAPEAEPVPASSDPDSYEARNHGGTARPVP